jgi:hypothetical protein
VIGRAFRGPNGLGGAVMHIQPAKTSSEQRQANVTFATDPLGFFGPIRNVALRYDATIRSDDEVAIHRSVSTRYLQPAFEIPGIDPSYPQPLSRVYSARVDVQLSKPLSSEQSITFFATDKAIDVTGDVVTGLNVFGTEFVFSAKIHAVVHAKNGDLATATAYADGTVQANSATPQTLWLNPTEIKEFKETSIATPTMPNGFSATTADILIGYSASSRRHLATVPLGATIRYPVLPQFFFYRARVRATASDGAISDGGEASIDIFQPTNEVKMPQAPIIMNAPITAPVAISSDTFRLEARAPEGLFEHVLRPVNPVNPGSAKSIIILTDERETRLPDVTVVGLSPLAGAYTWTVRNYPSIKRVDDFGGVDARRYPPVGTSAPRMITFESPSQ